MSSSPGNIVEMNDIEKRFGKVIALSRANLSIRENEIMGLVGDNGAGKSTLVKCLVGVHSPDSGTIKINGEEVQIQNPKDASNHRIATVYQDLALVDQLSVSSNVFLGQMPKKGFGPIKYIDWEYMRQESKRIIEEELNLVLDPDAQTEFLSGGERQAVAVARALVSDPDIIVLDEPTSALSAQATENVIDLINQLQERGITVLIISHTIEELVDIVDRITVLANGRDVGTLDSADASKERVVEMMVT